MKSSSNGFIRVTQLEGILNGLGLYLSPKEIQILASGFASDGKGGISGQEFVDAIHCLLYDVTSKRLFDEHRKKQLEMEEKETERKEREDIAWAKVMKELGESILIHDK